MAASQPFSVGPRNCIGRKQVILFFIYKLSTNNIFSLVHAQSRLILARIFFLFDIGLAESSRDWMNQKHHILWDKPPLNVYLSEAVRESSGPEAKDVT